VQEQSDGSITPELPGNEGGKEEVMVAKTRRRRSDCLAALLFAVLSAGAALAAVTGSLHVTVLDDSGNPLPGATVVIESPVQLGERVAITNVDGVVRFNAVVPGDYKVTARFPGAATVVLENNVVRLDSTTPVSIQLPREISETVVVTAEAPLVDVTSTTIGQDLDTRYVEEVPTVRTYQTNLNLVPGVDNGVGGNPVVQGGTSTDNLYLIDGINTTDPVTQTFGANINFDIIEEQNVHTAGHRAAYGGVVGLVSNLVTKSGGNTWSGGFNYFMEDADWSEDLKYRDSGSTKQTAWSTSYNLGGPILRDRLWHFSSWEVNDTEIVVVNTEGVEAPPRKFDSDYYFGKLTWQLNPNHRLNLQINGDPTDVPNSNALDPTIGPEQFAFTEQGGTNLSLRYTGVLSRDVVFEAQATRVRGSLDTYPANPGLGPNFSSVFGLSDAQFGRYNNEQYSDRDRDEYKADLSWFKHTSWGEHNLKFGVQYIETDFTSLNISSGGERYEDIPPIGFGSAADIINFGNPFFVQFVFWEGLVLENEGWQCSIGGLDCFDPEADALGTPSDQWLIHVPDGQGGFNDYSADDLVFPASLNAEAAADLGWLRFYRYQDSELQLGENPVGQDLLALYVQDEWRFRKWTTYVGLRVEQQKLRDTFGREFFEFDTTFSPRVGLTYDILGDGRHKVYGHWGRLYDPSSDGVTSFGNPAGDPRNEQQLWFDPLGDYFPIFSVGGIGTGAAVMAPVLKTPVTDELLVGWAGSLTDSLALEVTYVQRETTDIIEDLDPRPGQGPLNGSPTLEELGFGTAEIEDLPAAFVIYNPPGGVREYEGVNVSLRKRFSNRWSGLFGYTYGQFEGNISEDGAFGIIGDDYYLDPRLPYNYGKLGDIFNGGGVGSNDHFIKANGSYAFPFGLTLGGSITARSGYHYSLRDITTPNANVGDERTPTIWDGDPATLLNGLSVDTEAFSDLLGIEPGPELDAAIIGLMPLDLRSGRGAYSNDWVYFVNLSARYQFPIWKRLTGKLFLDVFTLLNQQDVTNTDGAFTVDAPVITPDNIGDRSIYNFQRPLARQFPRRYLLGIKLSF